MHSEGATHLVSNTNRRGLLRSHFERGFENPLANCLLAFSFFTVSTFSDVPYLRVHIENRNDFDKTPRRASRISSQAWNRWKNPCAAEKTSREATTTGTSRLPWKPSIIGAQNTHARWEKNKEARPQRGSGPAPSPHTHAHPLSLRTQRKAETQSFKRGAGLCIRRPIGLAVQAIRGAHSFSLSARGQSEEGDPTKENESRCHLLLSVYFFYYCPRGFRAVKTSRQVDLRRPRGRPSPKLKLRRDAWYNQASFSKLRGRVKQRNDRDDNEDRRGPHRWGGPLSREVSFLFPTDEDAAAAFASADTLARRCARHQRRWRLRARKTCCQQLSVHRHSSRSRRAWFVTERGGSRCAAFFRGESPA
ncbi:hypothetical protein MRX96_009536 [Rhipicephalus microplus]